ncbi:MAG: hypothetical protein LBI27_05955, partial [Clostridiales bacterium]|nr:hypothetical protein [Clostridiales bacterium]
MVQIEIDEETGVISKVDAAFNPKHIPVGIVIKESRPNRGDLKRQIINGKRCLIKGGSDPFWQQPLNEVMAAVIMRRLDVPHVDYTLINYNPCRVLTLAGILLFSFRRRYWWGG